MLGSLYVCIIKSTNLRKLLDRSSQKYSISLRGLTGCGAVFRLFWSPFKRALYEDKGKHSNWKGKIYGFFLGLNNRLYRLTNHI